MSLSRTGVIFDGDDTLWETQPLYERAKERFLRAMELQGFDPSEAKRHFDSIEINNARMLGFSKLRFPRSMSDTYRTLCRSYDKTIDEDVESFVESIGKSAYADNPRVFEGVREVLAKLKARNLCLILATKGDHDVQEEKISTSGLRQYFHHLYVLKLKDEGELTRIVKETGLDIRESWSIGNSIRSDINPALRVGMKAIWIPNQAWDFEDEKLIASDRVFRVDSIKDVADLIILQLEVRA
jgi:putative hydrolase of the HAD superfamily